MAKKQKYQPSRQERLICKNKVVYKNWMQAMEAALRQGLRHYKCPVCNHYHVTSQRSNKKP